MGGNNSYNIRWSFAMDAHQAKVLSRGYRHIDHSTPIPHSYSNCCCCCLTALLLLLWLLLPQLLFLLLLPPPPPLLLLLQSSPSNFHKASKQRVYVRLMAAAQPEPEQQPP